MLYEFAKFKEIESPKIGNPLKNKEKKALTVDQGLGGTASSRLFIAIY
jgi:hypothetical protein